MDNHTKPIKNQEDQSDIKYVLSVLNSDMLGSSWMLQDGEFTIGRQSKHHIILDDITVSRSHASILISEELVQIFDNNSTNGVYLNNIIINVKQIIKSGDKLQIGKFHLLFTKV